jgi:glycosyltransferase involved in cell wall biosynthesis
VRYVSQLSAALIREFPEDTYTLLSPKPDRRWWLHGIRRALRNCGAEVFHGTNFEVPYLSSVPSILTIHDLSPWRDPAWHSAAADRVRRRTPWLIRLRRARMILTVSEAIRREVISHFGVSPEAIRAVPLAAAPFFQPLEPEPGRPYFLFTGTLEPRKNIGALLEAWRAVRAETGADLLIVGRRREDFVPIPDEPGLTLLGEVRDDEMPRLFSNALALVYPSHYEGFGLPVLEAMQCGCPVITSQDPAITEVSGGAALQAASVHEIAEAMRAVAGTSALRAQLRSSGIARAGGFSWARTARETRDVYSAVLQ